MRKVVLYIAMSLDGFIADKNGGVDWLVNQDSYNQEPGSYPEFIKTVDTVILGYKTYHQIAAELSPDRWIYEGLKSYVLTHKQLESTDEIEFTSEDMGKLLTRLQQQQGKDIWICGGADIVNQLVRLDMIDRYQVSVIPTILGSGIRLFEQGDTEKRLELISTESYCGITDLVYRRIH